MHLFFEYAVCRIAWIMLTKWRNLRLNSPEQLADWLWCFDFDIILLPTNTLFHFSYSCCNLVEKTGREMLLLLLLREPCDDDFEGNQCSGLSRLPIVKLVNIIYGMTSVLLIYEEISIKKASQSMSAPAADAMATVLHWLYPGCKGEIHNGLIFMLQLAI